MARGLFVNFTLAQVQAIEARAVQLLTEGKTIMSVSGEGKSSSKQFSMPIDEVLDEVNYALERFRTGRVIRQVKADFRRRIW